jgi:hypothetical protein
MKVILEYNETTGDLFNTYNSQFMANIGMGLDIEKYVDTRKMKEYVAMAKDLKDSGFTADEIIDLIGKGY